MVANLGFGVLQTYNKLIREEYKEDAKMKEPVTAMDERGQFICRIAQHDVVIFTDPIRVEPDFRFRDTESLGAVDIKAFKQLSITKRRGELERLCKNPLEDSPEDDILDSE